MTLLISPDRFHLHQPLCASPGCFSAGFFSGLEFGFLSCFQFQILFWNTFPGIAFIYFIKKLSLDFSASRVACIWVVYFTKHNCGSKHTHTLGNLAWDFLWGSTHRHSSLFCPSLHTQISAFHLLCAEISFNHITSAIKGKICCLYFLQHHNSIPWLFEGTKWSKINYQWLPVLACCFLYF